MSDTATTRKPRVKNAEEIAVSELSDLLRQRAKIRAARVKFDADWTRIGAEIAAKQEQIAAFAGETLQEIE